MRGENCRRRAMSSMIVRLRLSIMNSVHGKSTSTDSGCRPCFKTTCTSIFDSNMSVLILTHATDATIWWIHQRSLELENGTQYGYSEGQCPLYSRYAFPTLPKRWTRKFRKGQHAPMQKQGRSCKVQDTIATCHMRTRSHTCNRWCKMQHREVDTLQAEQCCAEIPDALHP